MTRSSLLKRTSPHPTGVPRDGLPARTPRGRPWHGDRLYWLRRCEGFSVEAGGRDMGVVAYIVYDGHVDRPNSLAVRAHRLSRRTRLVPSSHDLEIIPADRCVVIDPQDGRAAAHRLGSPRGRS